MHQKITPKSLLLSVVQASENRAIPIKVLVSIGAIFGFTGSTVRVTATRLVRDGTLESDERGLYRLSDKGSLVSGFIGRWREGEKRLRKWDGDWLCCLTPRGTFRRSVDARRVFGFTGFKEGLPCLWVRPDNLSLPIDELDVFFHRIGGMEKAEMFIAKGFSRKVTEQWRRFLWPVETLIGNQKGVLDKMKKSAERIEKMPLENALVESFVIGSEAIRLLVMDPLLPEEIMTGAYRAALTEAMIAYDDMGKRIWSRRFEEIRIHRSPTHLQLVAGAP